MTNDLIKVDTWKEKEIILYDDNVRHWKYYDVNNKLLDEYYVRWVDYTHIINKMLIQYTVIKNKCQLFVKYKYALSEHTNQLFISSDEIIIRIRGYYLKPENRKIHDDYHDSKGYKKIYHSKNKNEGKYSNIRMNIRIPTIKVREEIISYMIQEQDINKIFHYGATHYQQLIEIRSDMIKELTDVFASVGSDGLTFNEYIDAWAKRLIKDTDNL